MKDFFLEFLEELFNVIKLFIGGAFVAFSYCIIGLLIF